MRTTLLLRGILALAVAIESIALAQPPASQAASSKGPFTPQTWAALHSAAAVAVAADGAILYQVTFGGDHGPTHRDWWTMDSAGAHAIKLDLPEGFSPMGFSKDGQSLYGAWTVNKLRQLAVFPLHDGKAPSVPTTVVLLPRGIQSASPSPDGKLFAVVADPRPPDPLDSVRHVQEPDQSSIYVVHVDGTAGAWWCASLKFVSGSVTVGGGAGDLAWNAAQRFPRRALAAAPHRPPQREHRHRCVQRYRRPPRRRHSEFRQRHCLGR